MRELFFSVFTFLALSTAVAQIGIGAPSPDPSAMLEIESTDKGFLPPRLTTTERDNILQPATGLIIYNQSTDCIEVFDGSFWNDLCTGAMSSSPNGNLTLANISYQGQSVIGVQGIGYNDEVIPAASTITVDIINSAATAQNYALVASDNATGLVYSATGTVPANATLPVVLSNNGALMPPFTCGLITMPLLGASNSLNLEPRIDVKSIPLDHPDWTFNEVSHGGQTFMDRNLGARRPATTFDDIFSYGNYYQWGRPADGHHITVWNGALKNGGYGVYSAITNLATTDAPSHNNFILVNSTPNDWRLNNNNNRWVTNNQGPCPSGYHVPTNADWNTADAAALGSGNGTNGGLTTGWDNVNEIFESSLRLPSAGFRSRVNNFLGGQGVVGYYWSSSINGANGRLLRVTSTASSTANNHRAFGFPVRCILD